MSRILRGLSSRVLPCGCLLGLYETYDGEVIELIDAPALSCSAVGHAAGNALPPQAPPPPAPNADGMN
ncbi:MAG: hypothetical protein ABI603_16675 [Acidobacteriota bacterium]